MAFSRRSGGSKPNQRAQQGQRHPGSAPRHSPLSPAPGQAANGEPEPPWWENSGPSTATPNATIIPSADAAHGGAPNDTSNNNLFTPSYTPTSGPTTDPQQHNPQLANTTNDERRPWEALTHHPDWDMPDWSELRKKRSTWLHLTAALMALWAASCFVPTEHLPGPLATLGYVAAATAPSMVAIIIPLILFSWRGRRWITITVATISALVPVVFFLGYATGADDAARGGRSTARIMVINANHGKAGVGDMVAAVRNGRIDVLVVTELTDTLKRQLIATGRPNVWTNLNDDQPGNSGVGVWSQWPLSDVQTFAATESPVVRMTVAANHRFSLVVADTATPFPSKTGAWVHDLGVIRSTVTSTQGPVVVAGTLHGIPTNADYRHLSRIGLADVADVSGQGLRPTWPTWAIVPFWPLDNILVSNGVTAAGAQSTVIGGSDHRAISATVGIPG